MTDELDFASASQALAGLDRLDVPAMELMYKLECSGEDFYNLLADRIGNEEVAVLLRRNAKEELGHARRIARAIAIKQGREFEPSDELQARYAVALPDRIDPAMLPLIVAGEQAGDAGYQGWAANEPDPQVARLLRLNGREETLHGERVTQAIAILERAPQP
jgi:rubrerythrin